VAMACRRSSKSEGGPKMPVDRALRPFRSCGIWSKDHPAREGNLGAGA
jgi:hypothetical protein